MSLRTNVHWFLRTELCYPQYVAQLMRTLDTFGSTRVDLMFEGTWEEDEDAGLQAIVTGNSNGMASNVLLEHVPELIRKDRGYFFSLGTTPLGSKIFHECTSSIPRDVSGNVAPMGPYIQIGHHKLDAGDRSEEYSARISLSIILWGWSHPTDFQQFQGRYFELDVIRKLNADLDAIWGPLERIMYTES